MDSSALDSFFLHKDSNDFPSPDSADEDGVLAIGGNLNKDTLLKAYRHGIFPWYNEGEPIVLVSSRPAVCFVSTKYKDQPQHEKRYQQHLFQFLF